MTAHTQTRTTGGEGGDDGSFQRQDSTFRAWVTDDDSSDFPLARGRYHLYVARACPWAHRTLIGRRLMGLEDAIGDILKRFTRTHRVRQGVDLRGAARTTFSTLHMELIRVSFGREDPQTLPATLRSHVDVLLYGVLDPT